MGATQRYDTIYTLLSIVTALSKSHPVVIIPVVFINRIHLTL